MASVHERVTASGDLTWQVRWREHGHQRSLTFETKSAANLAAKRIDTLGHAPDDLLTGHTVSPHTIGEAIERHLTQLVGVQPNTRDDYRRMARTHMAPLADMLIVDVDRTVLARWVDGMSETGLGAKTIKNIHGFLSAVLTTAVRDSLIDVNPCVGMRLPRHDPTEQRFLSADEYRQVRDELPEWAVPLADFLAGTGARFGEATALTIRDIDRDAGTVRINKAWKRAPSGWQIGPPKTKRSRRTVWLPAELVYVLAPSMSRELSALLFTGPNGGRVRQQTFGENWRKAAKRAGIDPPWPRVHDLRHSHAAWLIGQGVSLATIQDRLGHESITTTIDRYGHLESDLRVAAADAAGLLWRDAQTLTR